MKRLTKKDISVSGIYKTCCTQFRNDECHILQGNCSRCSHNDKVWGKLAEYEDLEEQGRLVRSPCKVGDTVYVNALCIYMPHLHHKPRYYNAEIIAIKRTKQKKLQLLVKPLPKDCRCSRASNRWFGESSIGKTVFLTEVEAEAELADMKGGASDEKIRHNP